MNKTEYTTMINCAAMLRMRIDMEHVFAARKYVRWMNQVTIFVENLFRNVDLSNPEQKGEFDQLVAHIGARIRTACVQIETSFPKEGEFGSLSATDEVAEFILALPRIGLKDEFEPTFRRQLTLNKLEKE